MKKDNKNKKDINRYQLAILISDKAKEREIQHRNPLTEDGEGNLSSNPKNYEKKNYVKEAHDEITKDYKK